MVSRHETDDGHLVGLETAQSTVLDEIVRVLVVPLVADVGADVVQQGAVLEPFAFLLAEAMARFQPVEDGERETGDLLCVRRDVVAALAELDHAAPPYVWIAIDRADVAGVAFDVVEHEAFPQRKVAEGDFLCAKPTEDRLKEQGASRRQVCASRVHVADLQALVKGQRGQAARQPGQRLGADSKIAHVIRRALFGRQRSQREDRAGRADHAFDAAPCELSQVGTGLAADVAHEPPPVGVRYGIGRHEALGEPEHADLETAAGAHPFGGTDGDLRAAAANVHDDGRALAEMATVGGSQVDEARFFSTGDDLYAKADGSSNGRHEIAAVLGLAHGTRGPGDDFVDAVRGGDAREF